MKCLTVMTRVMGYPEQTLFAIPCRRIKHTADVSHLCNDGSQACQIVTDTETFPVNESVHDVVIRLAMLGEDDDDEGE